MVVIHLAPRKLPRRSERIPIIQERARQRQEYMMERFRKVKHLYRQYWPSPSELKALELSSDQSIILNESIITFPVHFHRGYETESNESLTSLVNHLNDDEFQEGYSIKESPSQREQPLSKHQEDSFQHNSPRIHSIIELAPNSFKIIYEGKVSSTEDCISFIENSFNACYSQQEMVDD